MINTANGSSAAGKRIAQNGSSGRLPSAAGRRFGEGSQVLYGGLPPNGVSLELHDFELAGPLAGAGRFFPGSLELCFNLAGHGRVLCRAQTMQFEPRTIGFYTVGEPGLILERQAGERHRFVTLTVTHSLLRGQLASCDGALHPLAARVLADGRASELGTVTRLTSAQEQTVAQLIQPPVFQGARPLWYQGKVLQLLAEFLFERRGEDELFCDRQKRTARERVERVGAFLRQRLSEPPSLEEIGRAVGCSPFHLSRIFSREMGMTIPQYLRQLRMERAAELLRSGQCNVTEAAMEVGYSSLSHFSQAFCQAMGCCPGLYPHGRTR
jgi:AraC-like DNA-binding protein